MKYRVVLKAQVFGSPFFQKKTFLHRLFTKYYQQYYKVVSTLLSCFKGENK